MSQNTVEIVIKSTDKSKQGFDSATNSASGFKKSLTDVGKVAASVLTADLASNAASSMLQFAKSSIDAASNLGESVNAVKKVFGDSAIVIQDWGERNAASIGLSTRQFNEFATTLGSSLRNAGLDMQDATQWTIDLQKRAADMASVFNTDVSEALAAIQAGLRGEADPLERFGVGLSAAAVEAEAMAETGKKSAKSLEDQEKVTARLNLIMQQTESTAGDFEDTSDGLANAQRRLAAETENAQAKLGELFLPAMEKLVNVGASAVGSIDSIISALSNIPGGPSPFFERAEEIAALDEKFAALVANGGARSAAEQILELQKRAEEAGYSVEEFSAMFPKYGEALHDAAGKARTAAQAADEHAAAMEREYEQAIGTAKGILGIRDANRNLEESYDDAMESLKKNGKTLDVHTEKGRANQKALDGIADAAASMRKQILASGGSSTQVAAMMEISKQAYVNTAVKMGMAKSAAQALANQIFAIPKSTSTVANVSTAEAEARIRSLRISLQNLMAIAPAQRSYGTGRAHGGVQGAAGGGPRSGQTMVGEYGPELIDLAPGSTVHTAGDTASMMASSGGGGVGTLTVEWVGADAGDDFMAWLRKNIRIRGGVQSALGS